MNLVFLYEIVFVPIFQILTWIFLISELVEEEEALEEQVETIESKEVIKEEAAVKIQSMFRGFKVNGEGLQFYYTLIWLDFTS